MRNYARMLSKMMFITIGILLIAIAMVIITYLLVNRTNGQIETDRQLRRYLIYVPESYLSSTPAPLVISIHGFVQWPSHQKSLTNWNAMADKHGFIVAYPQGTGFPLRWNSQPLKDDPDAVSKDVEFFIELIDTLSDGYNIDRSRIYVNGMSNGGGMTHLLACELSDRITAIGSVAGAYLYPWELCQPSRPVPVIAFHGKNDSIVPYHGGPITTGDGEYEFSPVLEWAENWARINGCAYIPETIPAVNEVSGIRYTRCDENVEVIFYTVEDGGHTWPGGAELPIWITGYTTKDISATELMWDFFSMYTLGQ